MSEALVHSATGEQLLLSWEAVLKQFDNLIKFAANKAANNRNLDKMMSKEDLYQEGLMKLYDCWEIWCVGKNKDMNEFGAIFKVSLFRHVNKEAGGSAINHTDVEDVSFVLADSNQADLATKLYLENGVQIIRESLSTKNARILFEELLEPSDATIYQVYADIARKKCLKAQGQRVHVPSDTTVRMKHIQRAMGISNVAYEKAIKEIRAIAPEVLSEIYSGGK